MIRALRPRRLARVIRLELRLLVCLARWITGRHDARSAGSFSYHRGLGAFIWTVFALVLMEGAIVEVVLVVALPHTVWPWIGLGLHLYALLWMAGLHASLATRPHQLTERGLQVRDGLSTELAVPYPAIVAARTELRGNVGRSGLVSDGVDALLANGDATVRLSLDPGVPVLVAGYPAESPLTSVTGMTSLAITADEPRELVRALRAAQTDDVRQPAQPG